MLIVFGFCIYGCCIWEGKCNGEPKYYDTNRLYKTQFMSDSDATIIDMKEKRHSVGYTLINNKAAPSDSKAHTNSVYTNAGDTLATQINKNVT